MFMNSSSRIRPCTRRETLQFVVKRALSQVHMFFGDSPEALRLNPPIVQLKRAVAFPQEQPVVASRLLLPAEENYVTLLSRQWWRTVDADNVI